MRLTSLPVHFLCFAAACWVGGATATAQEQGRQNPDVVRVNTALVQTDVMIFDKQGAFVDGLKSEQFVLKVDGKPRDISFFERIEAGSRNEEAQLAAARGSAGDGTRPARRGAVPLDRGRTLFFFIDDLHLSPASLKYTRLLLQRFIDREMGQNDEAAIASTSGQIGFLQQLTDDKRVLQAATERIMAKGYTATDSERPVMTPYQAQLIEAENEDVLGYFVDELIRLNPQLPRNIAAGEIHNRASQIVQQTDFVTAATLNALNTLVRTSGGLPGRKLIFLISDGFLLNSKNADNDRIRQITSAAASAGAIIYSIDARGLLTGMPDATGERPFDPTGRLVRGAAGELTASQDGLNALAVDTGGRAFFNSNALSANVTTALKETSAYYLLAWRPENDQQRNQKARHVEVSVNGRTDLVIRLRRNFGAAPSGESSSDKKKTDQAGPRPASELIGEAIRSVYPKNDLPVSVSPYFLDLAQVGTTVTASIKVSTGSLVLESQGGQQVASVDLAGGVYDDQGKPVSSFSKHFTIKSNSSDGKAAPPDNFFYNHFCIVKPGLYQVRVAAVDPKQGRSGSATRWIEVPDLTSKTLRLSTLIVGERRTESDGELTADASEPGKAPEAIRQVFLNVDHRFAGSSHLRFLTFVYNASGNLPGAAPTAAPAKTGADESANNVAGTSIALTTDGPDLAVQVQLFRDNEPVVTMPLHKIQVSAPADPQRLPYAAEVSLEGLRPGRYFLLVTVVDRLAKASASQKFGFQVD